MRLLASCAIAVSLAATAPIRGSADAPPAEPKPQSSGLVEKAAAHLAQLDVTVNGPRDAASRLTPADFEVWVAQRKIEKFLLDAVCAPTPAGAVPDARTPRPASFLFYFDQRHLTPAGRRRALQAAREMVPRLIVHGSRGMVVSSAHRLRVFAELTSRPDEVLKALIEVENDPGQADPSAVREELRVAEMESTLIEQREEIKVGSDVIKAATAGTVEIDTGANRGRSAIGTPPKRARLFWETSPGRDGKESPGDRTSLFAAVSDNAWAEIASLARQFERDENAETTADFRRLAAAIAGLAETEPPKIVLYFSDTARQHAGAHFARMFSDRGRLADSGPGDLRMDRPRPGLDVAQGSSSEAAFDAVLTQAAARGVRFYAVQAEGLTASSPRVRDAQDTLAALSIETGGKPFLNGVAAGRMAADILDDLSCLYLVSFDPAGLPENRSLPVRVAVHATGLAAQVRGQIVVESEAARRESDLVAAFSRRGEGDTGPMSAAVIPTGYEKGRYTALVQVAVPPPSVPRGSWEIGASMVTGGSAREIAKRTIGTNTSGVPIVLEGVETFPAGPFEVVAVARDTSTNTIVSRRVVGAWPDIEKGAAIGPIAVLEPVTGAFVRDRATRTSGSLARAESEPLRADHPAAIVALVCRGKDGPAVIRADRRLVGESLMLLAPIDLDLGEEPCAQVRDVIPANTFGAGRFLYEIRAIADGNEVARGGRSFVVVKAPKEPDAPAP